ncbi:MAG: type IV pilin N-terminal domain-containing protein [Nitrososphaerales archaeon]|nr:type IV pilin N-terminal domain-containing protein [Nitrososphaerales archaeon]
MVRIKSGVTPVIATALLLVISIAILAILAYTATGLVTVPKRSPQAIFEVDISKTGSMGYGYIHIRQKAGDAVKSSDLKFIFDVKGVRSIIMPNANYMFVAYGDIDISITHSTGPAKITINCVYEKGGKRIPMPNILIRLYNITGNKLLKEGYTNTEGMLTWSLSMRSGTEYNVTLVSIDANGKLANNKMVKGTNHEFTFNSSTPNIKVDIVIKSGDWGYYYGVPWKFVPGQMPSANPSFWFGNFTYTPGTVSAGNGLSDWGVTYLWDDVHTMIRNWDDLERGDTVEVIAIYLPTNQVIWQSMVEVK